ncbi:MAG: hypothetical protein ACLQNG_02800 [Acidimicrobiales bacterium]
MSEIRQDLERRSSRLLRWYPKDWRSRYGDEFAELLVAEMADRPRSWRRSADVAWSGLLARLTSAGLTDHAIEPGDQVRASLASLWCALGVFLIFGVAMWSQLTIGWRWSPPDTRSTYAAMLLMSGAMLLFCVLALMAAIPIAGCILARVGRGESRGLLRPLLLLLVGAVFLTIGSRHFGNGWPGTGGHPWAQQGLVPGGVAAFMWASTLSVTSYWAHPHALAAFPTAELAWMAASPVAIVCEMVGAAKIVRRADLSRRVLRYEASLARVAAFGMVAFLVGSCSWVIDGHSGPNTLFHTGAIDVAGLVRMRVALAVAARALRRARHGGLALMQR